MTARELSLLFVGMRITKRCIHTDIHRCTRDTDRFTCTCTHTQIYKVPDYVDGAVSRKGDKSTVPFKVARQLDCEVRSTHISSRRTSIDMHSLAIPRLHVYRFRRCNQKRPESRAYTPLLSVTQRNRGKGPEREVGLLMALVVWRGKLFIHRRLHRVNNGSSFGANGIGLRALLITKISRVGVSITHTGYRYSPMDSCRNLTYARDLTRANHLTVWVSQNRLENASCVYTYVDMYVYVNFSYETFII